MATGAHDTEYNFIVFDSPSWVIVLFFFHSFNPHQFFSLQPARHSKLEKADILEMTVKHLETLQRQQVAMAAATDPNVANKFRAGFTECAGEVGRFPGLDAPVKRRLLQHLHNCLNSNNPPPATPAAETTSTTTTPNNNPPLQVHIVRAPVQNEPSIVQQTNSSNIILANTNGQGLQLVPTRLPNGDIALILPSSNSFRTARATVQTTPSTSPSPSISSTSSGSSPLPMLIPIPNRTSTNSPSPVQFDRLSVNPTSPPRQITILTTQNPQRLLIPAEKNVPLLTTVPYQEKSENLIQQRVIIPESYQKQEEVLKTYEEVPVIHNLQPPMIRVRKEESENMRNFNERPLVDETVYERNRVIMTQDGQIIQNDHRFISDYGKSYSADRETLLHIPDRDYYDSGAHSISPRSPQYMDSSDEQRYDGYYSDVRSYSPEMQKPLALVTNKKKYDDYENDERPWRPWWYLECEECFNFFFL